MKYGPKLRNSDKLAFRVLADGREICSKTPAGRREYLSRLTAMWIRDRGMCCLCGMPVDLKRATFEHKQGRGMGGSKRDDRIGENGVAHFFGNQAKGSISWDRYMELPLDVRVRNCHP